MKEHMEDNSQRSDFYIGKWISGGRRTVSGILPFGSDSIHNATRSRLVERENLFIGRLNPMLVIYPKSG